MKLPGLLIMIAAGISVAVDLLEVITHLLGMGLGVAHGGEEGFGQVLSGTMGLVIAIFGMALSGFIIFAASKMRAGKSYNIALAGAICAMLPCNGYCCCLLLPLGIWALVMLLKPEVKAGFQG